jgi:hypothetical protein
MSPECRPRYGRHVVTGDVAQGDEPATWWSDRIQYKEAGWTTTTQHRTDGGNGAAAYAASCSGTARTGALGSAPCGGTPVTPNAGDLLIIDQDASVQFLEPITFRVIGQRDWTTYQGWTWLDGYQLNAKGIAIERRTIFVRLDGLRRQP